LGLKKADRRITGDFEEIFRDIVALLVRRDHPSTHSREVLFGRKRTRTGVQSTSMREQQDQVKLLVKLRTAKK
jgi:hypothetical protein